jgi:hypothetical protein
MLGAASTDTKMNRPTPRQAQSFIAEIPDALRLPMSIQPQPDGTSCGPTCLHSVYHYWNDSEPLEDIIGRTGQLEPGGTFAVYLACDALRKSYRATIYTYNLNVFDPSWFTSTHVDLAQRLRLQSQAKQDSPRLQWATKGYLEFLQLGGRLRHMDLSRGLLHNLLRRRQPILTGLSSTFLYRTAREYGANDEPDDVRGKPAGHFVVIAGYDINRGKVLVLDPYQQNPYGQSHEYWIGVDRVIGAILLGIVTHDANLLVIHPRHRPQQALP